MTQEIALFSSTKTIDAVVSQPDTGFVKFGDYYFQMFDVAETAIVLDEERTLRTTRMTAHESRVYHESCWNLSEEAENTRDFLDRAAPKNPGAGRIVRNLVAGLDRVGGDKFPVSLINPDSIDLVESEGIPIPLRISRKEGKVSLGIFDFTAQGWYQLVWETVWAGGVWSSQKGTLRADIYIEATKTLLESDRPLYILGRKAYNF